MSSGSGHRHTVQTQRLPHGGLLEAAQGRHFALSPLGRAVAGRGGRQTLVEQQRAVGGRALPSGQQQRGWLLG
jgi:hypothetical protein